MLFYFIKLIFSFNNSDDDQLGFMSYFDYPFDDSSDDYNQKPAQFVSIDRAGWNAEPPQGKQDSLQLPVNKIIIGHTATKSCSTRDECIKLVKNIQNQQMKIRHFSDISSNWLISSDGIIFEGRGWTVAGAHTKGTYKFKYLLFRDILYRE